MRHLPMTNSRIKQVAETLINQVFDLMDETHVVRTIDEPIQEALGSFKYEETAPSHEVILQVVSDFVRHVYEHGLKPRQILSQAEAQAEALSILENHYESLGARGYDAAILDASNPKLDGLAHILERMTELIIRMARAKYVRWVCATRIDPSNWPLRCAMAQILLERSRPYLPENLLRCSPVQFADHLPLLIDLIQSTDTVPLKMLAGINP